MILTILILLVINIVINIILGGVITDNQGYIIKILEEIQWDINWKHKSNK